MSGSLESNKGCISSVLFSCSRISRKQDWDIQVHRCSTTTVLLPDILAHVRDFTHLLVILVNSFRSSTSFILCEPKLLI